MNGKSAGGGVKRSLVGFAAAPSGDVFVIHIVDDADEVFEIEASRENIELMVANLQSLIAGLQPPSASLDRGSEEAPA